MTEQNFDALRRAMVNGQLRTTAVNDPRVVTAMGTVPREAFVPAAQVPLAYVDTALPLADGRAMPAPMVVGRLLTEARLRPQDRALVIGAATGYAAAVLAELVAEVTALEEADGPQAQGPQDPRVTRVTGPLADGWAANAPYDLIYFDGAVEEVPQPIVDQLADGGRIATGLVTDGVSRLAIGRKAGEALGFATVVDVDVPRLPGFARPRGFRF